MKEITGYDLVHPTRTGKEFDLQKQIKSLSEQLKTERGINDLLNEELYRFRSDGRQGHQVQIAILHMLGGSVDIPDNVLTTVDFDSYISIEYDISTKITRVFLEPSPSKDDVYDT